MFDLAIEITIIVIAITAIIYIFFKFRATTGYEADQNFLTRKFGVWLWLLVPVIILGIDFSIAGSGTRILGLIESDSPGDTAVKVNDRKAPARTTAEATPVKIWNQEDLMIYGETIFQKACIVCHGANGEGIPDVFPSLKDSPIVNGELAANINIVLKGKPGTSMYAWGLRLNDHELAAVITYTRNSWGNDTGDTIQPTYIRDVRLHNQRVSH